MPPGAVAGQVSGEVVACDLELASLHPEGRHQPDPEVELGIVGRDLLMAGGLAVAGFHAHRQA